MSLPNMKGHVLCAVDVETTGVLAGYHEIIQIACVPLDQHFEPHPNYHFFYLNIAPEYQERMSEEAAKKHGISNEQLRDCVTQSRAIELFEEWFKGLELGLARKVVPLAHNWGFERAFLIHWLGLDACYDMWHVHPRDTMTLAATVNDLYEWHGRHAPFHRLALTSLCKRFDIQLDHAHDALSDCLATAQLYGALMRFLGG